MEKIKQVLLIRRDLKMRRGKEVAQGSHASMNFLIEKIRLNLNDEPNDQVTITLNNEEVAWISRGMAKICLQVTSEEELLKFHKNALAEGLPSSLIHDSGKTEFKGIVTITACAIGPAKSELIDKVTGGLALY